MSIVVWAFDVRADSHESSPRATRFRARRPSRLGRAWRARSQRPASDGRVSCHDRPRRDIADDAALCGDARAVADRDVVGDAHLAPDEHPRAHGDRAGEARLGRDDRPLTDVAVVPDVNVRVELRAAPMRWARGSPASIVHSGPMYTSSSMTTPPRCGTDRTAPPAPKAHPKPGCPMTAPGPMVTRAPTTTRGPRMAVGAMEQPGPTMAAVSGTIASSRRAAIAQAA
jgi:hypothetical protein